MAQVSWTGREAKILRDALRLSQRDFASRLGVSRTTVGEWEKRGEDITLSTDSQALLDTLLTMANLQEQDRFAQGLDENRHAVQRQQAVAQPRRDTSVDSLPSPDVKLEAPAGDFHFDGSPADTVRTIEAFAARDMATRRSVLVGLSLLAGEQLVQHVRRWTASLPLVRVRTDQLGDHEMAGLEESVIFFRRWDSSGRGGLHRKAVVGQLIAVTEAASQDASPGTHRRLLQVVAELAQLAGWMTYDTGAYGLAQRYYLLALDACRHAHAADLGAKIIGDMTQMSTALGWYDESLSLVRTAVATLPRNGNALVRAELFGLEARACAQLGPTEATAARRAVDACMETFDEAPSHRPDWVHYLTNAEVECLAANAYTELALGEPRRAVAAAYAERAEQHVANTIDARGRVYLRSRVLDELRLGRVRLAQREPTEAARIGIQALERAKEVRSSVVTKWLTGLARPLNQKFGSVADVSDFVEALTAYVQRPAPRGMP
jgi:transcriptional regulator with XRE-family HTH domain